MSWKVSRLWLRVVGDKRGALTAPVWPRDCESALMRAKALPREPTKRCAKVLHEASLQRITMVLRALVRPGDQRPSEARSRPGSTIS